MARVLAIIADGFEEIELTTPVDVLRRAGVEVVVAAIGEGIHVRGRSGIVMHADADLTSVSGRDFDCVFLPGGPGVQSLRKDPRVTAIVGRQAKAGHWIAAICAAPTVLNDAGLLEGRRYTAHPSVAGELKEILASERVVQDGKLITSRGAGTALDFGLAVVAALTSPEKAAEVARAICAE